MNRKTSTLFSVGLSLGLLAFGIWFIYSRQTSLWYGGRGWSMMGPGHGMMAGGGMGVVMSLFWLIVVISVIVLVSGLISSRNQLPGGTAGQESAMDILKRRYAGGEIDKAEFENKRRDLQS